MGPMTNKVMLLTALMLSATNMPIAGGKPNTCDEIANNPSVTPREPGVMFIKVARTPIIEK